MKGYQMELNFDDKQEAEEENDTPTNVTTSRGTKEFIQKMNEAIASDGLFTDEEMEGE